jgi:hypothetical protein
LKVRGVGEGHGIIVKLMTVINRRCLISKANAQKDIYFKDSEFVG